MDPAVLLSPNSSVAGTLLPGPGVFGFSYTIGTNPAYWPAAVPDDGQPLDNFMQQLIAGLTNLPPELVRPRWQEEPPPLPAWGTDWAAIGITTADLDPGYSWEGFDLVDASAYQMQQHEVMELLVTCYGPHADWYDGLVRDGLAIAQNREILYLVGMGLVEVGGRRRTPELVNQRWLGRVDRTIRIRREILRGYPVLWLLSVNGAIRLDDPPLTAPFGVRVFSDAIDVEDRATAITLEDGVTDVTLEHAGALPSDLIGLEDSVTPITLEDGVTVITLE